MEDDLVEVDVSQQLGELISQATNSGGLKLDEKVAKEIRKICRKSNGYIEYAHHLLTMQLCKEHAEIRLSAMQIIDELFMRSHVFRELLLSNFNQFLELTVETNIKKPLPLPKVAARNLKKQALDAIRRWNQQFGKGYRKLELGYLFLKEKKQIDFDDIYARSLIERQEEENKRKKLEDIAKRKRECVYNSMGEFMQEIKRLLVEMDTCFELLIPSYNERSDTGKRSVNNATCSKSNDMDDRKIGQDDSNSEENSQDNEIEGFTNEKMQGGEQELREHGMLSHAHNITVFVNSGVLNIQENADNCDILDLLRDSHRLLKQKYLFMVEKWLSILSKSQGEQQKIQDILDTKSTLLSAVKKFDELSIVPMSPISKKLLKRNIKIEEDDDFSDEFIDVKEKEDGNDDIFNELYSEYYKSMNPSTSTARAQTSQICFDNDEDSLNSLKRKEVLAAAPVIPYGVDLYHWEDDDHEIPEIEKNLPEPRFWYNAEDKDASMPMDEVVASVRTRMFTFPGKYEPVKWMCRSLLSNGKLCQRRDRYKCPFHGTIIPRNARGQPVNIDGRATEEVVANSNTQDEPQSEPSWKGIQNEIEAEKGIVFTRPGRKRKVKKRKSKSNLTDLKAEKNTSRYRLESKIFNPSTMKKIKQAQIDEMQKKASSKFLHNWNYCLRK